jgi:hypothetical protein
MGLGGSNTSKMPSDGFSGTSYVLPIMPSIPPMFVCGSPVVVRSQPIAVFGLPTVIHGLPITFFCLPKIIS